MSTAETPFEEKYPEHMKMDAVKVESQAIGEFIDNSPYVLAIWADEDDCWFDCREDHPHLKQENRSIIEVLANYFEVDLAALEREKRAMLEEMRDRA
jgi:hypothetical protein